MKTQSANHKNSHFSINCRGSLIDLSVPKIMGILNLTPDSFSDGGKFNEEKEALKQALIEYKGSILLICHEPEFYRDVVSQVWDCSKWTTKVL